MKYGWQLAVGSLQLAVSSWQLAKGNDEHSQQLIPLLQIANCQFPTKKLNVEYLIKWNQSP